MQTTLTNGKLHLVTCFMRLKVLFTTNLDFTFFQVFFSCIQHATMPPIFRHVDFLLSNVNHLLKPKILNNSMLNLL
jgi:hypothetical protein